MAVYLLSDEASSILNVRPGGSDAFEAAFREAQGILSGSPGYQRHELRRQHYVAVAGAGA